MKILHVGLESPDVRRGGLNNFLAALSSAQVAIGDDVDVIQVGTGLPATANWLQRWREVARCVRRSDATIIDVHFAAMAWWAVLSGALRGRPLVVHFQGPWAEESQWTGQRGLVVRVKKSMERSVLRRADRVITLSHAFATTAISDYGVSPARVEVLPPGVPARTDVTRDDARKHLGISPDAPVMVSVRRLVPRMGLHHAIAALVVLEDWTLAIAGTGPALEDLRQCAQDQGVADRVVFVGSVTEQQKQWWMAAANVCVVPSVAHEGFGLVVGSLWRWALPSRWLPLMDFATRLASYREWSRWLATMRMTWPWRCTARVLSTSIRTRSTSGHGPRWLVAPSASTSRPHRRVPLYASFSITRLNCQGANSHCAVWCRQWIGIVGVFMSFWPPTGRFEANSNLRVRR